MPMTPAFPEYMRVILGVLAFMNGGETISRHETLCLSKAVYFEARNQDLTTQMSIASFLYQFAQRNDKTICEEIYKSRGVRYPWTQKHDLPDMDNVLEYKAWELAVLLSALTIKEYIRQDVGDSTHFLMPYIIDQMPDWYDSELVVFKTGVVEFLQLEDYE